MLVAPPLEAVVFALCCWIAKSPIPCTVLTGEVTDVSPCLDYHFWQEVFVQGPTQCE